MSENEKRESEAALPGMSLEDFQFGVQAFVELRDCGKAQLFLGKRVSARIICEMDDFCGALKGISEREFSAKEADTQLSELEKYCAAWTRFGNKSSMVDFLCRMRYDEDPDAFAKGGEDPQSKKEEFENREREKVSLIEQAIFTAAAKQRLVRLATATTPCVEDVDIEVVESRKDHLQRKDVSDSFLRLRFRYSDSSREESPFALFMSPWSTPSLRGMSSFEFECDELDIDFLVRRLEAAKKRLLDSQQDKSSTQDN